MAEYRSGGFSPSVLDEELHELVIEAIQDDIVVRESRVPIAVSVAQGVVTVAGVVLSNTMRDRVLYAAATVPGVVKVIDQLYTDPEIEKAVARLLSADPTIRDELIEVHSYEGRVFLVGGVEDEAYRAAALVLAHTVPGVQDVVDRLSVMRENG